MSEKKKYNVLVPFTGSICVTIEVEKCPKDRSEAFDEAMKVLDEEDFSLGKDTSSAELGEWEFTTTVVEGNVCSAVLWEIEWEEIE